MKISIIHWYRDDKASKLMHTQHLIAKCISCMLISSGGLVILRSSSLSLILCQTVRSHLIVFKSV